MYRRGLGLNEKTLGPEHPSTLASRANLTLVLNRQVEHYGENTNHETHIKDAITNNSKVAIGKGKTASIQQKLGFLPPTHLPLMPKSTHPIPSQQRVPPEKPPKPSHLKLS
jgi:hypothetical protein